MKIYIATTNQGKLKEISESLSVLDIDVIPLDVDFEKLEDKVKEDGVTDMIEISRRKAIEALKFIQERDLEKHPIIVDDAGIQIEGLENELGINTGKFVKKNGGLVGLKKVLNEGAEATFLSVLSIIDEHMQEPLSFVGKVNGHISLKDDSELAQEGFPFNHLFIPEGDNRFMYQIPIKERGDFSHRLRAMKDLKEFLLENYKIEYKYPDNIKPFKIK